MGNASAVQVYRHAKKPVQRKADNGVVCYLGVVIRQWQSSRTTIMAFSVWGIFYMTLHLHLPTAVSPHWDAKASGNRQKTCPLSPHAGQWCQSQALLASTGIHTFASASCLCEVIYRSRGPCAALQTRPGKAKAEQQLETRSWKSICCLWARWRHTLQRLGYKVTKFM